MPSHHCYSNMPLTEQVDKKRTRKSPKLENVEIVWFSYDVILYGENPKEFISQKETTRCNKWVQQSCMGKYQCAIMFHMAAMSNL